MLLILLPSAIFSFGLELNLKKDAVPLELYIKIKEVDSLPYIQKLDEGYKSEIIYTIRTFESRGPARIFRPAGNTSTIIKTAGKDFLTGQYYISQNGNEISYINSETFLAAFFSCTALVPRKAASGEISIEVRVKADLVKRPPPLALLDPFFPGEITETGWVDYGG